MIRSLRLKDFKNFADETLRVGPFTVIVGTNASGKSNIRDAFRFLHGIGRGYTLAEIVGGKYGVGGQEEWARIRGATNEIARIETPTGGLPVPRKPGFGLEIELTVEQDTATYAIEVSTEINKDGFRITRERLQIAGATVYVKPQSKYEDRRVIVGDGRNIDVNLDRPALVQVLGERQVFPKRRRKRASPIGCQYLRKHAFSGVFTRSHAEAQLPRSDNTGRSGSESVRGPQGGLRRPQAKIDLDRMDSRVDPYGRKGS